MPDLFPNLKKIRQKNTINFLKHDVRKNKNKDDWVLQVEAAGAVILNRGEGIWLHIFIR